MTNKIFTSILLSSALLSLGAQAFAEESAASVAATTRSLTSGLNQSSASVLARRAGDSAAVADALAQSFGASAALATPLADSTGTRSFAAADWSLKVSADGTWAQGTKAFDYSKGAATKISADRLEHIGRDFISSKLSGVVQLQSNETLVLVQTNYLIRGGQSRDGVRAADVVLGSRVVFGRTLNGLRVVGGGSTVTVTLDSNGAPSAFDVDWPAYSTVTSAAAAPQDSVLKRIQSVATKRLGSTAAPLVAAAAAKYPVALTTDAQLTRLECGYYDRGSLAGGSSTVQPACHYEIVQTKQVQGGKIRNAVAGAVPAAVSYQSDSQWPEAQALAGETTKTVPGQTAKAK
jgi:hypothetical protein